MEERKGISKINIVLIVMLILCLAASTLVIVLSKSETQINLIGKSGDKIEKSYATTEGESNTWDVSENGDGSVTATLSDDGTLTISGTGKMKKNGSSSGTPWYSKREKIINVKIEDGITSICNYAFWGCKNLTNIKIANTVISILDSPFENCTSLISIEVDTNNKIYCDVDGVLYTKDKTEIIRYPEGKKETTYKILGGVTRVREDSFSGCENLTSIDIPDGVISIGSYAFESCTRLTSMEIPDSVMSIENRAFSGCTSLTTIQIPEGVTSISGFAFEECSNLTNIEIPASITSIEYGLFLGCGKLTNIKVDSNNTKYCDVDGVLYTKDKTIIIQYPADKKESKYNIVEGVTSIRSYAFYGCTSLTSIKIPDTVTSIENQAFGDCTRLTSIEIPSSVEGLYNQWFDGSKVTYLVNTGEEIELPNILKRAQDAADILYSSEPFSLYDCTIEDGKVKIDENATYCTIKIKDGKLEGLTYIILYNTWDISEKGDGSVIATLADDGTLTISGIGKMKDWSDSDKSDWHGIKDIIKTVIIEEGVTSIGYNAFKTCYYLTSIKIPDSVTSIGSSAFENCYRLTSIEVPRGVTSIGDFTFKYCNNLTTIEVNENNMNYADDDGVLYNKDKTEIIEYPIGRKDIRYSIVEGVTSIRRYAFYGCKNLKIKIPSSVTYIGYYSLNVNNLTIICHQGSYAETYAKEYEISYKTIEQEIDKIKLMIKKIQPNTTIENLKTSLQSEILYEVMDKEGYILEDMSAIVMTGYKVKLENNDIYILIVIGDCNGDGESNIRDILEINKHRLNKSNLTGEYLEASDVNKDGEVNIRDILEINKFRLGKVGIL